MVLSPGEVREFRDLHWVLAWRDIKVRYKQTALGAGAARHWRTVFPPDGGDLCGRGVTSRRAGPLWAGIVMGVADGV